MNSHRVHGLVIAGVALALSSNAAVPPVPAKPTIVLQRVGIPNTAREMGMGLAEFPPYAVKSWRRAADPEVCYVLEGTVTVRAKHRLPRTFHAGESFRIPARLVHSTRAGPKGAKVLAAWVHSPGERFNFPVAAPHL